MPQAKNILNNGNIQITKSTMQRKLASYDINFILHNYTDSTLQAYHCSIHSTLPYPVNDVQDFASFCKPNLVGIL